jgi:hypothetical protein
MNAHGIRTRGTVAVLALLTVGATACGSSSAKSSSATQPEPSTIAAGSGGATATTDSGGASTTTSVAGGATGHVGDTLTNPDQYVPSDVATVTLVKVVDPATPVDASNVPTPGSRWVGLEMTIVDNGDNAPLAVQVARISGSDGKNYDSGAGIDDSFTGCTSTMQHALQPNQKATFCPGFLLPNGVTITKVGYSTRASDPSQPSEITWTVP